MNASEQLAAFRFEDGAWLERPGRRIVTRGTARTLIVPAGSDQLERLSDQVRSELGPGELAVGALGFSSSNQALLEVAEEFRIDHDPDPLPIPPPRRQARSLRLEVLPTRDRYRQDVSLALQRIRSGELEKVVLARMLIAHTDTPYDRHRMLSLLAHREPASSLFAVQGFIGATPELVIAREGSRFFSRPLAGTRSNRPGAAEELLASAKDRHEHAIVVDAIAESLERFASKLEVDPEPSVVETASLVHLATTIEGTLSEPSTSVIDLLAAIHPTPAIAGSPREAALRAIGEIESFDRTRYGGAVGWVDGNGDGEFSLTLRCAEVRGRIAMLFAGAGIVADSDPDLELAETEAKFAPMLDALQRC